MPAWATQPSAPPALELPLSQLSRGLTGHKGDPSRDVSASGSSARNLNEGRQACVLLPFRLSRGGRTLTFRIMIDLCKVYDISYVNHKTSQGWPDGSVG